MERKKENKKTNPFVDEELQAKELQFITIDTLKKMVSANGKWKLVKLKDIAISITAGGTPRRSVCEYWENGAIPWLKISDLKNTYISASEEKITQKGLHESSAKLFKEGTILYTIFATLGVIAILDIEATTNQAIAGIVPNKDVIDPKYLYYCLKNEKRNILSKKSHATQDNINLTILKNHEIPLPPLSIQKKIVSFIEKAEKLKQRRQKADENTNKIIQNIFYDMFFNKGHSMKKIKDFVKKTGTTDPRKNPDEEFFYVDISSIDNKKGLIINTQKLKGSDAPSRARRVIKSGDIIVSTVRPNLNATALIPKELDNQVCSTGYCVLETNNELNNYYLFAYTRLNEFIEQLVRKAKGASYPAVTNSDVLDTLIPYPPLELQNQFAEIVKKIESMKEKQKKSTEDVNQLFDALMQKAFKGELTK